MLSRWIRPGTDSGANAAALFIFDVDADLGIALQFELDRDMPRSPLDDPAI